MSQKNDNRRHGLHEDKQDPSTGSAEPAREFSPSDLPDESEPDERSESPVPAPAPGIPVSEHDYQRLKDDARRRSNAQDVPAQEDHPRKGG